jgi:alkylated DNA repair dioxygenase AlkB
MSLQDGSTLSDLQTEFTRNGYVVIRGFLDPATTSTVSKVIEYGVHQNTYKVRPTDVPNTDWVGAPSAYFRYAEPLVEVILENSAEELSAVVQKQLVPTYSYARVYIKGDQLGRHTDRPSCEYSVTVHVATVGEPWPVWVQKVGGQPTQLVLSPGDAVLYKGCEVAHWRNPMVNCDINVQFMLHYVDHDGPNADYKWDKRPGLGHLDTSRR